MTREVDINVLVSLYNQKLASLANQNVLLEAKVQTLTKDLQDLESEKDSILLRLLEEQNSKKVTTPKSRSKKSEDYQNAEVG
tara:strand:- start:854 stop:1099 length:246 start_codon:yes stop_codon:yes gene_type:complete